MDIIHTPFQQVLYETLKDNPFLFQNVTIGWDDLKWNNLSSLVTADDLDQTVISTLHAEQIFMSIFNQYKAMSRPRKNFERFMVKRQRTTNGGNFKAISDFIGFRIWCQVSEITTITTMINEIATANDGLFVVRNPIFIDGKYTDIIDFVYVYVPSIRYVIEFQIGHPFAAYTFKIDSYLRDNPDGSTISLWTDGYYEYVRDYILAKSNQTEISNTKDDLVQRTQMLFGDQIPTELVTIFEQWI